MTKKISNATLHRYPIYLKALKKIQKDGKDKIMSNELAKYVNIKSTTIRRDFSLIGTLGKQGYGYNVNDLIDIFSKELGGEYNEKIILIGCGNFGKTILNYKNWSDVVGEIVCGFDTVIEDKQDLNVPVYHIDELAEKIPFGSKIAILTGADNIQATVDKLIDCGIIGIVNFTHEHVNVSEGVVIRDVDVVSSIQEIVFQTSDRYSKD